jgi:hypothetical protein
MASARDEKAALAAKIVVANVHMPKVLRMRNLLFMAASG